MPKGLRWLTIICFGFALFLPLSLIPAGGHYINGTEVTFAEFWRRGGGPLFFAMGIVFPLMGFGFLRAQNWSRYAFVGIQIAEAIFLMQSFLTGGRAVSFRTTLGSIWTATSATDMLVMLSWVALTTYYLFVPRKVREYFRKSG
jgi:hypothetical protein